MREDWRERLRGHRVTVMGLARTGLAAASLLSRLGARVTVTELRGREELKETLARLPPGVEVEVGGHTEDAFSGCQLLVVSPGVPASNPFIALARGEGAEVVSEVELAFRLARAPLVAVTGTNGKTTTTTLIGEILSADGIRVGVGGNIGSPLIGLVEEELDFLVAEVSSFQLEWVKELRPRVALITNLSPDHLDRHATFEEYKALKARLLIRQRPDDSLILNADDPETVGLSRGSPALQFRFSREGPKGWGAFLLGEGIVIRRPAPGGADGAFDMSVCRLPELSPSGSLNLENILAALAAGAALGVSTPAMRRVALSFKGLPHRMELVGELDGVSYVNDSKGTNVGAAARALESCGGRVVLIAGGRDKGGDLAPLAQALKRRGKGLILLGEARERFRKALGDSCPLLEVESLDEALSQARKLAQEGDTVLLSPACASFDMFRDYEERGELFRQLVLSMGARERTS